MIPCPQGTGRASRAVIIQHTMRRLADRGRLLRRSTHNSNNNSRHGDLILALEARLPRDLSREAPQHRLPGRDTSRRDLTRATRDRHSTATLIAHSLSFLRRARRCTTYRQARINNSHPRTTLVLPSMVIKILPERRLRAGWCPSVMKTAPCP